MKNCNELILNMQIIQHFHEFIFNEIIVQKPALSIQNNLNLLMENLSIVLIL